MIDCIVYVSSVLNPKKNARKTACLENFALGVKNVGHSVQVEYSNQYQPSRLAVILGWITASSTGTNIMLRKQIIQEQQRRGLHTMCIDASCWKYLDNHSTYLRYSLGGPFYNTAEYANHNSGPEKWKEISQRLEIQLENTKTNDQGYILICVQRDGGFSMKNLDPMVWLDKTIQQIRQVTNRRILVRPHPGTWQDPANPLFDKKRQPKKYLNKYYFNDFQPVVNKYQVEILDPTVSQLSDNLKQAHSAVFFNSSASVAAVCQGIPIFVEDPSCVSWMVANKDITKIETPKIFDRQQWIYDLATAHWSDDDACTGKIYQKFLPYLTNVTS
jgi:hypothetical protein